MAGLTITDPDVSLLASVATQFESATGGSDEAWAGSPFDWMRRRPSRQLGAIFERITAAFLAEKGFSVGKSPDSEADCLIDGVRVEIKGSTLWANDQGYKFQQLRDQNYSFVFCLGISPFNVHSWVIPKGVVMDGVGVLPGLTHQHGGQRGTDTAWLTVRPQSIPAWLEKYGGTLGEATKILRNLISGG